MALATKCPHCNTIFRVAADQLKLRGGIVRCGSCHQVFDGNAALVEPAAKPTPVIPDVVAELAAPPAAVPAVSDYVHGAPVDFELDFADAPAPAPAGAQVMAKPADAVPAPETPAPAVWRTATAAPAPSPEPSPDDAALAAVARAFATAGTPPRPAQAAPAAGHPLSDLLSPDDAFSAATSDLPVAAPSAAPAVPPPAAPSAAIDEKLLAWEDLPANESAASDAAAMAAVARAFNAATAHAPEQATPVPAQPAVAEAPAAAEPEPELAPPPDEAALSPDTGLTEDTAAPAAPEPAREEAEPEERSAAAEAPLVETIELWASNQAHPDGRIEPLLDTPQEHIVVAALDDLHHFEDLPAEEPLPDNAPADAPAVTVDELSPTGEPWSLSEPESNPDPDLLHAIAAVNTDVPDDGFSLSEEEAPAPPKLSRSERALKRAKSRLEAHAAAQPGPEPEPELEAGDPAAEEAAAAARMRAIAGVDEAEAEDLDHSDLSFVRRVERSQKYGKAITLTMAVGIPLLLAGLALQGAVTFRDTLAASYPQLKPTLAAICQPLGCKIALPAQLDALSVEQGELATMADSTFSFSTVLRNQSKTVQAWPHLELTLNDNADKPVLRRVFAPREYLASPADVEKGFGPHSEQSIKLYFELKELKASGYHIAIFYP